MTLRLKKLFIAISFILLIDGGTQNGLVLANLARRPLFLFNAALDRLVGILECESCCRKITNKRLGIC